MARLTEKDLAANEQWAAEWIEYPGHTVASVVRTLTAEVRRLRHLLRDFYESDGAFLSSLCSVPSVARQH